MKIKDFRREELRLQAELLRNDSKMTDKDYKDFLFKVYTEKNEFEIDNLYRHLLELSEMPEAEIEAAMEEFNGGMTSVFNDEYGVSETDRSESRENDD